MTTTTEPVPAAACAVSSGGECTCGGGCEPTHANAQLPAMLQEASAVGCTITLTEAPAQLERIELLRPHVIGLERRRGLLKISFDRAADTTAIGEFIELERGCCSFLHINREDTAGATRVTFSTDDRDREPALATIARTFDPAEPPREPEAAGVAGSGRKNKTLLGVFGVACLACFLPGLLAAGAAGSVAAALGGETVIAGTTLAVVLAIGALITLRRRRSQSNSAGCGC